MSSPTASYFDDSSMIRRVHREAVVALAGGRALLMMAAHPLAFEGFFASTDSLEDPYARLRRTGEVLDAIAWGPRARADRLTSRVRGIHRGVHGTLPEAAGPFAAGTSYQASDPTLLLWILACLVDSSLLVYDRYVERMDDDERDRYWRDQRVVGRLFGLPEADMPADIGGFDEYMSDMLRSDELMITPRARALGRQIVLKAPVPTALLALRELANFITVGLLPAGLRRQYGLSWDPVRSVVLHGGALYLKRVLPLAPERVRLVASARSRPLSASPVMPG